MVDWEKIITKVTAMVCGTIVSCYAISQGHNGYIALVAVVVLFGGEKALDKLLNRNKKEKEE